MYIDYLISTQVPNFKSNGNRPHKTLLFGWNIKCSPYFGESSWWYQILGRWENRWSFILDRPWPKASVSSVYFEALVKATWPSKTMLLYFFYQSSRPNMTEICPAWKLIRCRGKEQDTFASGNGFFRFIPTWPKRTLICEFTSFGEPIEMNGWGSGLFGQ